MRWQRWEPRQRSRREESFHVSRVTLRKVSAPKSGAAAYLGSAPHYRRGRLPYPSALPDLLATALDLDGTGRLLDVGCGPGLLTLELAPLFDATLGIDADPQMISEARAVATERGASTVNFLHVSAEALPAGLGRFRVVTFAQSFHWLDSHLVAAALLDLLEPGAACAVIYGWRLRGDADTAGPHPLPPYREVEKLLSRFRGSRRSVTVAPGDEAAALMSVGLQGPHHHHPFRRRGRHHQHRRPGGALPVPLRLQPTLTELVVDRVRGRGQVTPHRRNAHRPLRRATPERPGQRMDQRFSRTGAKRVPGSTHR